MPTIISRIQYIPIGIFRAIVRLIGKSSMPTDFVRRGRDARARYGRVDTS